jgi:hypothetical protein
MNRYKKYFTDDITINLSPGDHFKHGKFKNKDAIVKSFGKNEKGEDIIITPEGKEIQLLKIRLIKEANQKYNKIIDTVIKSYIKKNSRNEFFTGDCVNFATALYDFVEMNFENIYKNYELMTMYDEFVSHTVLYLDGLYLDASGINTKQSIENKIKSGAGKITWKKDEGIYNIFGKDSKKILYGLQDEFNKLFPIEANFEENTKRYKKFFEWKTFLPKEAINSYFLDLKNKKKRENILQDTWPMPIESLLNIKPANLCAKNAYEYAKKTGLKVAFGWLLCADDSILIYDKKQDRDIPYVRPIYHVWNVSQNNKVIDTTKLKSPIYFIEYRVIDTASIDKFKNYENYLQWCDFNGVF